MRGQDGTARKAGIRALAALMLAAACGCSSVRLLRQTPDGGVVSIPSNSNQWPTYYRNRAEYLMKKKCPAGYAIDHEEEVEDNPAADDGRKANETFEYNGALERVSNYSHKEYHIFFRCVPPPPGPLLPD